MFPVGVCVEVCWSAEWYGCPTEAYAVILSDEREWCDFKGSHVSVWDGRSKGPIGTDDFHETFELFETVTDIVVSDLWVVVEVTSVKAVVCV